jgi:transposase InsO family protein
MMSSGSSIAIAGNSLPAGAKLTNTCIACGTQWPAIAALETPCADIEESSTSLEHARAEIERWRREYNEQRPKKLLGGLTPAEYAKQLAGKAVTIPESSKALRY